MLESRIIVIQSILVSCFCLPVHSWPEYAPEYLRLEIGWLEPRVPANVKCEILWLPGLYFRFIQRIIDRG